VSSQANIGEEKQDPCTGSASIEFENGTTGINRIPFAIMSGGWLAPVLFFWLYVWGPMRPFAYPTGDLAPSVLAFAAAVAACFALAWLPASYYRIKSFERTGRLYEVLGVRLFRSLVPDGDLANRWRRRAEPGLRIVRNRRQAMAFVRRTEQSEKGHLVLLGMGLLSAAYACSIGWWGWAAYISAGNLVVNIYPVLLQRYTRNRIERILSRDRQAIDKTS
jgi:hypothetical protein